MEFLAQLVNALQIGSIYALIALGYNMVYGIVRLINFAHGDLIMVGSYTALFTMPWLTALFTGFGWPWWTILIAVIILAAIVCMIFGVTVETVAYRPLLKRNAPRISLLITALGVSMLLENGVSYFISPNPQSISIGVPVVNFYGISLSTILTVIVTAVLTVCLILLVNRSRMGKAMRAVSEDSGAAKLMGINVNTTITFTFAIGSVLAGVGSIFYCMAYPQATPYMGFMLGLKAFVAAVLGGIGSVQGAIVGGLILGLSETMAKAFGFSNWADAVAFGILILVLLFLPSGIMGKNVREKV